MTVLTYVQFEQEIICHFVLLSPLLSYFNHVTPATVVAWVLHPFAGLYLLLVLLCTICISFFKIILHSY